MASKTYTAKELREAVLKMKSFQGNRLTAIRIEGALLYAADVVERCEDLLARLRPYRDEDVIGALDYILRGDAEEGASNGQH